MKKRYIFYPLFLGLFMAAGILLGHYLSYNGMDNSLMATTSVQKRKLNRLIDIIDQRYVDEVNTDSIVDVTVNDILGNLDPHSVYIPNDQAADAATDLRGNFVGIGIRYFVNQDTISVLSTIKDGPSREAGIKSGDKILYLDGQPLFGEDKLSTDALKGEKGSEITLGVLQPGFDEIINVPVTRGNVAIESIDAAYMLTDKLGYIKVNRFAETTTEEFDVAIEKLKNEGASEIAVDLRDNSGGVLSAALSMADEFLREDQLILFQKDRENQRKNSYASSDGDFEDKQVYILINENSASASEIVAGALQDNDKGTIIGRRSFGKGLVQQEMQLGDGSAVRITVARYYTPTGRSIQRPYDTGNEDYYNEYIERFENGEMQDENNIEVNDSLKFTTPAGKVVYGGGGIIPDVFVPAPSSFAEQTLEYFARTGYADRIANDFLQNEGKDLRKLPKNEFIENYKIPRSLIDEFMASARRNQRSLRLNKYRDYLALLLKASLAEQLYGTDVKIMMLNSQDTMILKLKELSAAN
ncbi:S41 family peptidase [Nonlabens ponticola]|uniref:S41 family peptidase n=1 Tax=Nonlabens ponticola TaxID=2496866 RepID=A0A3S9MWF1_9FLAO|nr:S41 family peptidase [Nonlabens ponticola]AZQ43510.1 S41 family peptidase [Nonlabens ponticola]